MKFLITGCARSGTVYTWEVLTKAGVACGHERAFNIEDRGPWLVSDIAWEAAPHLPRVRREFPEVRVFHQVRHPLDVIASLEFYGLFSGSAEEPYRRYIYMHCPQVEEGGELERCTRYWLGWNEMCEPHAELRYRVEDMDEGLLRRIAGVPLGDVKAALSVATNTNTKGPHRSLTLASLPPHLRDEVEAKARQYGYEV